MMNAAALSKTKEDILMHISSKGPSLPATIASELRVPPLFISAFLSELYHEEKVLMSHLKVGTTSLYLLPGQEKLLENFIQYLNSREKEAYHIVKQKKFVRDSELQPVHRVAIRNIPDFARPVPRDGETCWEYIYTSASVLQEKEDRADLSRSIPQTLDSPQPILQQVKKVEDNINDIEVQIHAPVEQKEQKPRKRAPVRKVQEEKAFSLSLQASQPTTPFSEEIKQFLEKNNYNIISTLMADKKEATFKATISGPHGLQSYLVLAKDKKKLKEEELQQALEQAHSQRLLCLVLARGELDKKSSNFVSSWSNFMSYKQF